MHIGQNMIEELKRAVGVTPSGAVEFCVAARKRLAWIDWNLLLEIVAGYIPVTAGGDGDIGGWIDWDAVIREYNKTA